MMAAWRTQMLLVAIVLLLGVAVYLTLDLNRSGRQEVMAQFNELQGLLVRQATHELNSLLEASAKDLLAMAALPSVQHLDARQGLADLQAYCQKVGRPWPPGVLVVSEDGAVAFSTATSPSGVTDCAGTPFFEWAKTRGNRLKIFASSWAQAPSLPEDQAAGGRLLLATPLYREAPESAPGRPLRLWSGALVMTLDVQPMLAEHLHLGSQNDAHRIWMLDRDGTVVLHSEHPEMIRQNVFRIKQECYQCHASFDYAERLLASNRPGVVDYQLKDRPKKIAAFAPLRFGNADWTMVVNAPSAAVTGFLQRSFAKTLWLMWVITLGLSLSAWVLYRANASKARAEAAAKEWQVKSKAQEEVRRAEERYRTLFEHSPDGVLMLDSDTLQPVEFSEAAARQLGYARDEFARLRVADYEVAESPCWTQSRLEGLQREGRACFETQHRSKTGQLRNVEVIAHRLTLDGRGVFHCIYHDITERKRAEQALAHRTTQLEALYQASLGIAAETDPATLYQTITSQALALFQGKAGTLWVHRPKREVLELVVNMGGDPSLAGACVKRGEDVAGKVWENDAPLIVADYPRWESRMPGLGQQPCASAMAAPIRWGEMFLGVLRVCSDQPDFFTRADLSLLSLLANQAAIAVKNAELMAQMREDATTKTILLHDANHRMKNNLLRLTEMVELEREHAPTTVAGLQASLVDLESRLRGMEVVHTMLSQQQLKPLPLRELVTQVATAALSGATAHQHIYLSTEAPSQPVWILPDQATALALIINELTTNSLKHAFHHREQGHLQLRLGVEAGRRNRSLIRLLYRDDGPGWPDAILRGQRTAVGLHLIQASVRSPLRGELNLRNEMGAVAELTFELALPA